MPRKLTEPIKTRLKNKVASALTYAYNFKKLKEIREEIELFLNDNPSKKLKAEAQKRLQEFDELTNVLDYTAETYPSDIKNPSTPAQRQRRERVQKRAATRTGVDRTDYDTDESIETEEEGPPPKPKPYIPQAPKKKKVRMKSPRGREKRRRQKAQSLENLSIIMKKVKEKMERTTSESTDHKDILKLIKKGQDEYTRLVFQGGVSVDAVRDIADALMRAEVKVKNLSAERKKKVKAQKRERRDMEEEDKQATEKRDEEKAEKREAEGMAAEEKEARKIRLYEKGRKRFKKKRGEREEEKEGEMEETKEDTAAEMKKLAMKNKMEMERFYQREEEKRQEKKVVKTDVNARVAAKDILDPENLEVEASNGTEGTKELQQKNHLHVDEINEPADDEQKGEERAPPPAEQAQPPAQQAPPEQPMEVDPPAAAPVAAPVAAPAQPPPAAPGQPTVAQPVPQPQEMVEEKVAYPGDMGMRPGATQAFAPTTMDQDDAKHRMRKSIKQLKTEIMCFRELYKDKIAKIKQLSRVSMANKTIDEIRSLHKQHSDAIKNYFTAHRGLRVGVIVDPSVLGINLQGLQNMIAPRVPIVQPPVQQARDTVRPRDPYARGGVPQANRMSEVHYQLGGLRASGLGGGYDRDIEALNKGQDKQEDRRLHNRGTTRFGKAPVYKNYGYQNKKTFIASGITLKAEKPKSEC